jgi:YHS domain-containing protein
MFRGFFRIFVIILAFAFIRYFFYLVKKAFSGQPRRAGGHASAARQGEQLLRDPICGTFVAERSAVTATARGVTHHFCSVACRDKFMAA